MDTENVKMLETIVNIDNKNRGDGIRTHGGLALTQPFQDCTLNRSDTPLGFNKYFRYSTSIT